MLFIYMAQEPPVDFERFISNLDGVPYYDNFVIFFGTHVLSGFYRTSRSYRELEVVTQSLERKLRRGISNLPSITDKTLEPFNKGLYLAYLIMRNYVASDAELALPVGTPR